MYLELVRRDQERIERLFRQSMIHSHWKDASVGRDWPADVGQYVRELAGRYRGFFVWGPVGTGKTRLLVGALNDRIGEGHSALYITVPDLLLRIRSTFERDQRLDDATEAELIEEASNVDWLGLDDLGVGKMTDWARTELFQIVNRRYEREKPIIATSNKHLDDLASDELLGWPIASRLVHICGKPVDFSNREDQRRKGLS